MALPENIRLGIWREYDREGLSVLAQSKKWGCSQSAIVTARAWGAGYDTSQANKIPSRITPNECGWNKLPSCERELRLNELRKICTQ